MASRVVPASSWRTLTWGTPPRIGSTSEWWVHHGATGTATLATLRAYERYHVLTKKWLAPGYNFAITGDGTIYELRGWLRQGAHTSGRNTVSHAVLLVGDWTRGTVPQPMVDSLVWLTREGHRVGALRSATISGGHREAPGQNTQCPGAGGIDAVRRARAALTASAPALPPSPPVVTVPSEEDIVASIEDLVEAIRKNPDQLVRQRVNEAVRLGQVAAAGAVAAIRAEVGLPADPASDMVHVKRIREGVEGYDLAEVRRRLEKAATNRTA